MFIRIPVIAFGLGFLLSLPLAGESASGAPSPTASMNAVRLRVFHPERIASWGFGSKQVIRWSITGLPSGNRTVAAFLTSEGDRKRGMIMHTLAGNGKDQANYVVNLIRYGKEDVALRDGRYTLSLAVFMDSLPPSDDAGRIWIEKKAGKVAIEGANAAMGPDGGTLPDSAAHAP